MKRCDKISKILDEIAVWSRSLGLDQKSTPLNQMIKLNQEYGELNTAIEKKNKIELMDGIGDTIVVATVIMTQFEYVTTAKVVCYNHKIKTIISDSELFVVQMELSNFIEQACIYYPTIKQVDSRWRRLSYLEQSYSRLIVAMDNFSKAQNLDLYECLNMALTTISFRSGEIRDGIFVKVAPNATIIVPIKKLGLEHNLLTDEINHYTMTRNIKFFKIEFDYCDEIKHYEVNNASRI